MQMNTLLASSFRALLTPHLFLLLLSCVPCGAGCAAPLAEAGGPPTLEASREEDQTDSPRILGFEERFERKWWQETREPIASPPSTPFDDDPDLLKLYLWSFQKGVDRGLRERESFSTICYFKRPESRYDEARQAGFERGRKTVMNLVMRIYEEIIRDLTQELERLR